MKYAISLVALCLLPACMGGGSDGPSAPTTQLNTDFGTLLNGARMSNGAGEVDFDIRVANAADFHARDMVRDGYFGHDDVIDPLADCGDPCDAGERLLDQGYTWKVFYEGIGRGNNLTLQQLLDAWEAGGAGADFSVDNDNGASNNINLADFEHFGIAKAGPDNNQRWVLLLADPTDP
ncbi:CAP domain-containing protein [Yoonia sp. SDW83-1]|uniref:CAP domain-containing protein n=1 Tax=Yoonia sp. SDW83-1 TaxID=3366945 RepID=UPI00398C39FE